MYNEIKSIKEPTEEDCYLGIIRVYQREVGNLQQENKQLKEDKKKAREYIKLNIRDIDYDTEEYDYLMNILDDKNE